MFPEKRKDGSWIKKIVFNFPVPVDGEEVKELDVYKRQVMSHEKSLSIAHLLSVLSLSISTVIMHRTFC